jgi:hypothetical protein
MVQPCTLQGTTNHVVQQITIDVAAAESPAQNKPSAEAKRRSARSPDVIATVDGSSNFVTGWHDVGAGLDGNGAIVPRRTTGLRPSCNA